MQPSEAVDIEAFLHVGQWVIFYPAAHDKDGPRLEAVIRGWQKGVYILLDIKPDTQRRLTFRHANECVVRFLYEGRACAFEAELIDWQKGSNSLAFRISWPLQIRTAQVRTGERIDVAIPCHVHCDGETVSGEIKDLAARGCGVATTMTPEKGSKIQLTFTLPDGIQVKEAQADVRNIRETGTAASYLGCQLTEGSPSQCLVAFYVWTSLLRLRSSEEQRPHVLIVDAELANEKTLQDQWAPLDCDVHQCASPIDGVFLARLKVPAAIFIRAGWEHTSGLSLCRLLRASPALAQTPLYVYGGDAPIEQEQLGEAGCSGYLPGLAGHSEAYAAVQEALASQRQEVPGQTTDAP